jgi:hypothetical protein
MTHFRFATVLCLLLLGLQPGIAQENSFHSSDNSFSISLPADFGPASSPPGDTIFAVESPSRQITLFCSKAEAVEIGIDAFAEKMKRNLYDGGAQIHGKAKAPLASQPAASYLVGGVVPNKESLFIFNLRPDGVYTFVLNYPTGQRKQAGQVWNALAPAFKFRAVEKKTKS